nr:MAG: hypothetical protein [Bacteriophage sp.]
MQKDLVFFKKGGEEGVALTSTSANHIANLAKEYIQGVETQLNNICFFNAEVALVGSVGGASTIQTGGTSEVLNDLQSLLEGVAQAKSLIAWLREGIKAKEDLMKGLQTISLEDWCKENGMVKPETPDHGHVLTEVEYYASLPVKERNRYYQLETEAAVFGKYIHPDGHLSNARKELKDKLQHPHRVDGRGRDALIYTYTPTVDVAEVDNVFFELQKKHREVQAQLNAMKYNCEQSVNESTNKVNTEYMAASQKYQAELKDILGAFKTWKDEKSQEYSKLKIIIPHLLLGIYNTINSLGK